VENEKEGDGEMGRVMWELEMVVMKLLLWW